MIASCQTLTNHLIAQKRSGEEKIKEWERGIEGRELMEKRRVAPGYLDTGITMLVPVRMGGVDARKEGEKEKNGEGQSVEGREGEELDRMFGGMGL